MGVWGFSVVRRVGSEVEIVVERGGEKVALGSWKLLGSSLLHAGQS
jgi:hypothetical protein